VRGEDIRQGALFSYRSIEDRIPADHGLRKLREYVDLILERLSPEFDKIYSAEGRPSIPPERLLRALLLQILYTIRSERQLMEQLDYNLLFRWFVGLGMDDEVWDATVYTKNRERLFEGNIAKRFFNEVLELATERGLLSTDHFTVDGTLIQAWAGHKSFKRKDSSGPSNRNDGPPPPTGGGSNPDADFRGEKRSNQTHASTTDPDARLCKKGREGAQLCYAGHVLTENRNGLVIRVEATIATGKCERETALEMLGDLDGAHPITLGADKAYDARDFIQELRVLNVTPHVAQSDRSRRSAIDRRTTRHPGYALSQRKRKRVEEVFGWLKTVGGLRKTKYKGLRKVDWIFTFATAAYNLLRIRNLAGSPG
jgi:transposase